MPLDYSLVSCSADLIDLPDFSDKLQSIVFNMMFVGVRDLKNQQQCDTFYTRYIAKNAVDSATHKSDGTVYLQWEDVMNFYGITTNVSSYTDAAFKKMLIEALMSKSWQSFVDQRVAYADSLIEVEDEPTQELTMPAGLFHKLYREETSFRDEARGWVADCDADWEELNADGCAHYIEHQYEGGVKEFIKVWRDTIQD